MLAVVLRVRDLDDALFDERSLKPPDRRRIGAAVAGADRRGCIVPAEDPLAKRSDETVPRVVPVSGDNNHAQALAADDVLQNGAPSHRTAGG